MTDSELDELVEVQKYIHELGEAGFYSITPYGEIQVRDSIMKDIAPLDQWDIDQKVSYKGSCGGEGLVTYWRHIYRYRGLTFKAITYHPLNEASNPPDESLAPEE